MLSGSAQRVFPPGRPARPGGFTLVELLLVMFVLSVLVALVVGVGSHVIEQARITETVQTQTTLLSAIDAYRRVTGHYPDEDPNAEGSIQRLMEVLQAAGDHSARGEEIRKQVTPYLQAGAGSLQVDAFGNTMLYFAKRGIGGKPLILSAGPDGDFGHNPPDVTKQRDNIRSDTHGMEGTETH